jgi:putative photosynthetic complex assembly protein 2
VDYLIAAAGTVFGWWFTTGLILLLNHLPRATHRWSMAVSTALLLLALITVPAVTRDVTLAGAMLAYGQALLLWGWLEMGYLMGFVTGPSNRACPPDATGWTRFALALKTSLYHELFVLVIVLLVIGLSAGAPNQIAALTCASLWLMRWSAKLNLFLGVANFHADWLPRSQQYLVTYMKQRRINLLFPFSVVVGSCAAALFLHRAIDATDAFGAAGYTIVGLLLSLGVLEHWFLVLPIQDSKLWQWAMPRQPEALSGSPSGRPPAGKSLAVAATFD